MKKDLTYSDYQVGSPELVAKLVEDHHGWASSIARSVARSWNMDWQLDGLDGGAYEGLLFSAQRYDPTRGVPFRAYARRRIHESCTQEARQSKAWQQGVGVNTPEEHNAREISARLFDLFPDLRDGILPITMDEGENSIRGAIRQLLASASVIATFKESIDNPDYALQHKLMLEVIAELEAVHQAIIWAIYWEGQSMRALATEWGTDELAVIREHQAILAHVLTRLNNPKSSLKKKLKVRPGLRPVAQKLRREKASPPFEQLKQVAPLLLLILAERLF